MLHGLQEQKVHIHVYDNRYIRQPVRIEFHEFRGSTTPFLVDMVA